MSLRRALQTAFLACSAVRVLAGYMNVTLSVGEGLETSVNYMPPLGTTSGWAQGPEAISTDEAGATASLSFQGTAIQVSTSAAENASVSYQLDARAVSSSEVGFTPSFTKLENAVHILVISNLARQRLTLHYITFTTCVIDSSTSCSSLDEFPPVAPSSSRKSLAIGPIIGGVVGGVIVIGIITAYFLWRKHRSKKASPTANLASITVQDNDREGTADASTNPDGQAERENTTQQTELAPNVPISEKQELEANRYAASTRARDSVAATSMNAIPISEYDHHQWVPDFRPYSPDSITGRSSFRTSRPLPQPPPGVQATATLPELSPGPLEPPLASTNEEASDGEERSMNPTQEPPRTDDLHISDSPPAYTAYTASRT